MTTSFIPSIAKSVCVQGKQEEKEENEFGVSLHSCSLGVKSLFGRLGLLYGACHLL